MVDVDTRIDDSDDDACAVEPERTGAHVVGVRGRYGGVQLKPGHLIQVETDDAGNVGNREDAGWQDRSAQNRFGAPDQVQPGGREGVHVRALDHEDHSERLRVARHVPTAPGGDLARHRRGIGRVGHAQVRQQGCQTRAEPGGHGTAGLLPPPSSVSAVAPVRSVRSAPLIVAPDDRSHRGSSPSPE